MVNVIWDGVRDWSTEPELVSLSPEGGGGVTTQGRFGVYIFAFGFGCGLG